jgi:hypothetical protein
MRFRTLLIAIALVHLLPVAAWASFKPLRVLAPELLGLHCTDQGVCVDDLTRLAEAVALKSEAVAYVSSRVGRFDVVPRAVFCSSAACAKSFGFTHQGAYNVGTFGLVVGPRGWHPYFVRHELIHHLQNEHLGSLNAWFFKPSWFLEGMAYSWSENPRRPLPEPLEHWRHEFEIWYPAVGHQKLWHAAATL